MLTGKVRGRCGGCPLRAIGGGRRVGLMPSARSRSHCVPMNVMDMMEVVVVLLLIALFLRLPVALDRVEAWAAVCR